jgi:hypothetical protein
MIMFRYFYMTVCYYLNAIGTIKRLFLQRYRVPSALQTKCWGIGLSSEIRRLGFLVSADVSEEHIVSLLRMKRLLAFLSLRKVTWDNQVHTEGCYMRYWDTQRRVLYVRYWGTHRNLLCVRYRDIHGSVFCVEMPRYAHKRVAWHWDRHRSELGMRYRGAHSSVLYVRYRTLLHVRYTQKRVRHEVQRCSLKRVMCEIQNLLTREIHTQEHKGDSLRQSHWTMLVFNANVAKAPAKNCFRQEISAIFSISVLQNT